VASAPFPTAATLSLTRSAIAPGDEESARFGVQWYLQGLNRYRDSGDYLPVSGAFGKAVAAALAGSRTPGVQRSFVLGSLRVERLYRKPWGTQALVDVRVTIADRAVDGSSPDQWETGLLRLSGERRLQVIDAWDDARSRWFNGRVPDEPAGLRQAIGTAVAQHLRTESWAFGGVESFISGLAPTPFETSRAAYVAGFDRTATPFRAFADVTAAIEQFDTFAEMPGGIATVRLAATAVTTDAAGAAQRQPVVRTVRVFFGNWMPQVVDEEVTPGLWRSGGDLALFDIDVSRA
jgi:hypothetical protein